VRHDKLTPNTLETAMSVWNAIAFPISIENIVTPSTVVDAGPVRDTTIYYAENASGVSTENMRSFHSHRIKSKTLFAPSAAFLGGSGSSNSSKPGALLELACGKAGDLWKWIQSGFSNVVGVDLFEDNIINSRDGAYRRLYNAKSRNNVAATQKIVFIPADVGEPLGPERISDISDPTLKAIASSLWKVGKSDPKLKAYEGMLNGEFDCASCQFAIHYFFESKAKLAVFLDNVEGMLKPGGLFIGTCMDGEMVAARLSNSKVIEAKRDDNGAQIWRIERMYENGGSFDSSKPEKSYGHRIEVFMDSIGKSTPEFLVHFDLLTSELKKRGMRLLNKAELKRAGGLSSSTAMFHDVYNSTPFERMASAASSSSASSTASSTASKVQQQEQQQEEQQQEQQQDTSKYEEVDKKKRKKASAEKPLQNSVVVGGRNAAADPVDAARAAAALRMTDKEKSFSFLNRWFIFVKK
jgi:hypothetical protein